MVETVIFAFWIAIFAILGLLIGSFLNVCIYRLPRGLNIVHGHSFCPACNHELGALDLVPVLSYLLLGRKCRYCKAPIASRYAKIELLCGVYFAMTAVFWPPQTFSWPGWLAPVGFLSAYDPTIPIAAMTLLAFCSLLVWSMIFWDIRQIPRGVYISTFIFLAVRMALVPDQLLVQITGAFLALIFALVLAVFRLMPATADFQRMHFTAGIGLIGLSAGLWVVQPALAVILVELLVINLFSRRRGQNTQKQASLLWRTMPLQALLIASVTQLIYA